MSDPERIGRILEGVEKLKAEMLAKEKAKQEEMRLWIEESIKRREAAGAAEAAQIERNPPWKPFEGTGVVEIFEALVGVNPEWEIEFEKAVIEVEGHRRESARILLIMEPYRWVGVDYFNMTESGVFGGTGIVVDMVVSGSRRGRGLYINGKKIDNYGDVDKEIIEGIVRPKENVTGLTPFLGR